MDYDKSIVDFGNYPGEGNLSVFYTVLVWSIKKNSKSAGKISYQFVPRERIVEVNNKFLNHDYSTDIITFDYSAGRKISGEILICPEQVLVNSQDLGVSYLSELHRVMFHGILHLIGYNDKTDEEKQIMRKEEDLCLERLKVLGNEQL